MILIQSGKGAEVASTFGGSSQTVFGSSGGANFFTKLTAGLATVFMLTSLTIAVFGTGGSTFDAPSAQAESPNQVDTSEEPKAGTATEESADKTPKPIESEKKDSTEEAK